MRLEDDVRHEGAVSSRHHAQHARNQLLDFLCEIPGRATYDALLGLSQFHAEQFPRDRMLGLAKRRAKADTADREVVVAETSARALPDTARLSNCCCAGVIHHLFMVSTSPAEGDPLSESSGKTIVETLAGLFLPHLLTCSVQRAGSVKVCQ